MLVCARLRHVAGTQWGVRRYMNMDHLYNMEADTASDIISCYSIIVLNNILVEFTSFPLYYDGIAYLFRGIYKS